MSPYKPSRWPAIPGGTSQALAEEAAKRRTSQLGQMAVVALEMFRRLGRLEEDLDTSRAAQSRMSDNMYHLNLQALADANRLRALLDENMRYKAKNEELEKEAKRLLDACVQQNREIEQTLGKALGFPYYADDQITFPGSTREDGVCVGEHVAESLALVAAEEIGKLRKALSALMAATEPVLWQQQPNGTVDVYALDHSEFNAARKAAREALPGKKEVTDE